MEQQNEKRICRIGDRASLVKTFTEKDLQDFADIITHSPYLKEENNTTNNTCNTDCKTEHKND